MKIDNVKLELAIASREMKLKDLCAEAKVDETALRNIRQGKRTPRLSTIGRIAKALNVDVQDIIQEGD
ncbi:MAG: helix-turn-helix transcriptional regulator [Clostridia bacterium]|nr:helix-turn-helix transcriptional regulator [Clostridia bacterium]